MKFESLSGAVLAGGKGERIKGQDKGLLFYQGEPMVISVANALSQVAETVFINANRNIDQYSKFGFDVIMDVETFQDRGPLSGLLSCLMHAQSSHLLISPCDTPRISVAAFKSLKRKAQESPEKIYCLQDGSGKHPLHALLPVRSSMNGLKAFLESGKRNNVMAFYELFGIEVISWLHSGELLNVNRTEDLKA